MRSDIVPGIIFPDYELWDHSAKRSIPPNYKDKIQWSNCVKELGGMLVSAHLESTPAQA